MTDHGKPPTPSGCPATCDLFPEQCAGCSLDCYAAGEWSADDLDDGPDLRVSYQDDWSRWWEGRT